MSEDMFEFKVVSFNRQELEKLREIVEHVRRFGYHRKTDIYTGSIVRAKRGDSND